MAAQILCETVPYLPDELITTNILPRLPVKLIGRCRCVSKPWQSALSTRQFAKRHLKFHADDPEDLIEAISALRILTFTGDGEGAVSRQVNFRFEENSSFLMVGSCNGLILLQTLNLDFRKILMNPITLEALILPECPDTKTPSYSLGYDSSKDDYKVVCLSDFDESLSDSDVDDLGERFLDVYSVKMKCWRRIGRSPYLHTGHYPGPGVLLNGCIHWVGVDSQSSSSLSIVAFDLASEEFKKILFPIIDDELAIVFWVLGGRLALMPKPDWRKGLIDVWVMEEYGVQDSWIKRTIKCPYSEDIVEAYPEYMFFCMLNDDEILLSKDSKQLLACNWRNGSWRDMVVVGAPQGLASTSVNFKESLVSPNHGYEGLV